MRAFKNCKIDSAVFLLTQQGQWHRWIMALDHIQKLLFYWISGVNDTPESWVSGAIDTAESWLSSINGALKLEYLGELDTFFLNYLWVWNRGIGRDIWRKKSELKNLVRLPFSRGTALYFYGPQLFTSISLYFYEGLKLVYTTLSQFFNWLIWGNIFTF
jgi:hypothetical protein